jgi:hypothetical protein
MDNFKNGLASFGIPVIPNGFFGPDSKVFFLDAANGSDSLDGTTPANAFKTASVAYAALTANKHDVLYIIGGNTSVSLGTTGLAWQKSYTHVIGVGGVKNYSNRARFTIGSTAVDVADMFKLAANNCTFDNIEFQFGVADSGCLSAVTISGGQRNVFSNCNLQGVGNATMSATGAADLTLINAQENEFWNCTIGNNQAVRDADATNVLFKTGSSMNNFERCNFIGGLASGATAYSMFTVSGNDGIAGTNWHRDCLYHCISTSKSVTVASLWSIPANMQTAYVYLMNPAWGANVTALDANARGILYCNTPAAVASAAGGKVTNV